MSTETVSDVTAADLRLEKLREIRATFDGWSETEFFKADDTMRGLEYVDGTVELLAMPSVPHQQIQRGLLFAVFASLEQSGRARVFAAGLKLQTYENRYREPDITVVLAEHADRHDEVKFVYADLVVEIVSPDDRKRDLVTKRAEYAAAGIPEYWIVDPADGSLTILVLDGAEYREHARATTGDVTSATIDGVAVDVDATIGRFCR